MDINRWGILLAVIENRDTKTVLGQVGPSVTANLEFGHVPSCVVVSWSSHNSILGFI